MVSHGWWWMRIMLGLLRVLRYVGGDRLSDRDGFIVGIHFDGVFFFEIPVVGFLHVCVQKMIIKFR